MNILNVEHVDKTFANRKILEDLSLGISDKDKIGVIGVNGAGKSTLLAIAAMALRPDAGQVVKKTRLRIAYLPQNPIFDEEKSLLDNVVMAMDHQEEHWDSQGEAKSMLERFGLRDPKACISKLSGGQKKRAALVATLLTPSELMILDEPTNHLDHEMVEWLENYLRSYRGAILMVTHDRYFLDAVSNQILEIDGQKAYRYECNYSGFLEYKQARREDALAKERKQAALYKQDLAWMQRGARARSTKQKAHIQRFEALRDRDKLVEERNVAIDTLSSRLGGKTILLDHVGKSYGSHRLFADFSYHFNKKDRIGIVGANGSGKSTLLRIMQGILAPDEGSVEIGQTVQFGYFSQENEALDESMRVIDYIKEQAEYIRTEDGLVSASNMCERFLFDGEMQYAPIAKLSGGEKRRLYLLKVLMQAPNVLILDEPTNDLDIQTLQVLEDYLDRFSGILIVVSHDRYFLDRVVNRILYFLPEGRIGQSEGGYQEYKERLEQAGIRLVQGRTDGNMRQGTAGRKKEEMQASSSRDSWKQERKKKKFSYMEQKEYDSIGGEIEALEERLRQIDEEMLANATQVGKLAELTREKEEKDAALESKMARYFELEEMKESFG